LIPCKGIENFLCIFADVKNTGYIIVAIILFIIAVGSVLLDYFVPAMGDDLRFWYFLGLDDYVVPDRKALSFVLGHIEGCNGRIFDFMGPVLINLLPRYMASVVMGFMAGLFFYSILRVTDIPKHGHTAFSAVLLAVAIVSMPWWDSMFMRVCQFNYLWGSTFCLLFIDRFYRNTVIKESKTKLALFFLLGFCAGGTHEQTGVAMSLMFVLWRLFRFIQFDSSRRKILVAGLLSGTIVSLSSPALWHRAAESTGGGGGSSVMLISATFPLLLVLLITVGLCMCVKKGRVYIGKIVSSSWGIVVGGAIVSGMIGVASGIPGRTGFFSEACSIVAMARMALDINLRISRPVAVSIVTVCVVFISFHFIESVKYQSVLYKEFHDVNKAYIESTDGIVYYDFTNRYDVSPMTLYRVKGVADADDWWNLHVLQEVYGGEGKFPVVLPESLRGRLDDFSDSITCGMTTVYSHRPDYVVVTQDDVMLQYYPGPAPRVVTFKGDGKKDVWIAAPLVCDPGDIHIQKKTL